MIKISKQRLVTFTLIYILVCSVFVDLFNGYTQLIKHSETVLQHLYKGVIIMLGIYFLRISTRFGVLLLYLILAMLISFCYWNAFCNIYDLKLEITNLSKLIYPYFIFSFLIYNQKYIDTSKIIQYVVWYGTIAALSMFVTEYLGISHKKYGEDFGFGIQGLFVAGNDLGLMFLMCNSLACYLFLKTSKFTYAIINLLITSASIMIGSVTGIFGSVLILGALIFNGLFLSKGKVINEYKVKIWQKIYFISLVVLSIPILYLVIDFIVTIDSYNVKKFSIDRLLSGGAREGLRESAQAAIMSSNLGEILLGKGISGLYNEVGGLLGYGENMKAIELDQYELIGGYGILIGGGLLLAPIVLACLYIRAFLKHKSLFNYWGTIVLLLFLGHAFQAGHAYGNVMATQIVAVLAFCYLKDKKHINE